MLRAVVWCAVSTKPQANEDEKESLPTQESDAVRLCEREGWYIVDTLRVPGHSRRYTDLHECAADMRRAGIDAFDRLVSHWQRRDFDVLIVRDGNRFARTQSLHARVVEDTIDAGARIYSLASGWIDSTNYRMFIAMDGYKAAGEIDELQKKRRIGMQGRFERGWPLGKLPMSHRVIRDYRGKSISCEPRPELSRLWHDLVDVLCEGVAWDGVGNALFERGHARANGKAYSGAQLHTSVFNPIFWGHSAKNANNGRDGRRFGLWSFDESVPPPDDVPVLRNVFPPALTGEPAERLKQELRRRSEIVGGRSRATASSPFTGLLVCGGCGYRMRYSQSRDYRGYGCETNRSIKRGLGRSTCTADHYWISIRAVQAWFDGQIKRMVELQQPALLAERNEAKPDPVYLESLSEEIAAAEKRAEGLMVQLATTPPELVSTLQRLIEDTAEHIKRLRDRQDAVERAEKEAVARRAALHHAYREVETSDIWARSATEINQVLHALLGGNVAIVHNGVIVGTGEPPYKHPRRTKN